MSKSAPKVCIGIGDSESQPCCIPDCGVQVPNKKAKSSITIHGKVYCSKHIESAMHVFNDSIEPPPTEAEVQAIMEQGVIPRLEEEEELPTPTPKVNDNSGLSPNMPFNDAVRKLFSYSQEWPVTDFESEQAKGALGLLSKKYCISLEEIQRRIEDIPREKPAPVRTRHGKKSWD